MLNQQMPPYQPMNFGQGNPLFGGQMPPQGMPQAPQMAPQAPMPQAMQPQGMMPQGSNPVGVGLDPQTAQTLSQPARRGGMFGSGIDGGKFLTNLLTNWSASRGDPAAQSFLAANQRKAQMALEEQVYQNHQQSELQRQMALYKYQMDNPNTPEMELARAAGYQPGTPEWSQKMGDAFNNKVNPFQMIDYHDGQGNVTKVLMRPGQTPPPPTAPVGEVKPYVQGGQTGAPSGGFHY